MTNRQKSIKKKSIAATGLPAQHYFADHDITIISSIDDAIAVNLNRTVLADDGDGGGGDGDYSGGGGGGGGGGGSGGSGGSSAAAAVRLRWLDGRL